MFRPAVAALSLVGLAWIAWNIVAQLPLRTLRVACDPSLHRYWLDSDDSPVDRVILCRHGAPGDLILRVDLLSGQIDELLNVPGPVTGLRSSRHLRWIARDEVGTGIAVVPTVAGRKPFTIPEHIDDNAKEKRCLLLDANDRFLTIIVMDFPITKVTAIEVWDVETQKRRLRIDGWFEMATLSHDGSRLAAFALPDFKSVIVWDVATGKELTKLAVDGPADGLAFLADGRLMVGDDRQSGITAWSSNFDKPTIDCQFDAILGYSWTPRTRSTPDRHVLLPRPNGAGHTLWDISNHPPRCKDAELGLDSNSSYNQTIDLAGRQLVVGDHQGTRLYEFPSLTRLPLQDAGPTTLPQFSPSGRWMIAGSMHGSSTVKDWLRHYLPASWFMGSDGQSIIWDTSSGQICNRVPGLDVMAWHNDDAAVWMDATPTGSTTEKVFALYPTVAPRAPWWLWLLTLLGGVVIIGDIRRTLNYLKPLTAT